ncbi:hypothetical protein [Actinomadura logoneensis]|uniref:hypothetical protein n=1 Tax=Actinomadura logoneensis TaxID=2293572 RepID=UPI0018F2319A|nr:hypothetical protein [Actinomadura logoneensis]
MSKRPSTVSAAAALEGAEGLAAVGFGLFSGIETAVGAAVDPTSAVAVTVLALGGGLAMLGCARMLLRGDSRGRAPIVLTQLFALPVAWSLWQSEQPFYAVPLGVVAVLALLLVLSPPVTAWINFQSGDDEDGSEAGDGRGESQAGSQGDSQADGADRKTGSNS